MKGENLKVFVKQKSRVADSIVLLELVPTDGESLPSFEAGSHINVSLPGGVTRPYSICNNPADTSRYHIAVHLEEDSRGGSKAVHDLVTAGTALEISSPVNHFPLDPSAEKSLLFAGGIGITPILAMAYQLENAGRSWEMHYSARSRSRAAFLDEIERSKLAEFSRLHFDDGGDEQKLNCKSILSAENGAGTHLYVCGPSGFIDFILKTAKEVGWPDERVHFERFAGSPVDLSPGRAFKLHLAQTGITLDVPADKLVMDVILDAGIDLAISCEQGVCGTCITKVLAGTPDHRDQCLTDSERKTSFTPCCSRSLSETLSIDL